jgi:hypothetical protein
MTSDSALTDNDHGPRDSAQEAEYLGVSEHTLRQWRWLGKGPRWVKVGRHIRYPRADTQRWLDQGADSPDQALYTAAPRPRRRQAS